MCVCVRQRAKERESQLCERVCERDRACERERVEYVNVYVYEKERERERKR